VRILDLVPAGGEGATVRLAVGGVPVIVRLPLAGEHNARNAAAALAVAAVLGVPVLRAAEGIGRATLPPHRSRVLQVGGRTVLDDCYNANPASMSAALRTLADSAGTSRHSFALLGDMLELGDDARALHSALGREVAARRLAGLAVLGSLGADIAQGARDGGLPADRVLVTDDPDIAAAEIARWSAPGDWILVKASRGMRLERAIEAPGRVLGAATAKPARAAR
jgi:UDP-N-acetylmuramyl pentapeptide synthase